MLLALSSHSKSLFSTCWIILLMYRTAQACVFPVRTFSYLQYFNTSMLCFRCVCHISDPVWVHTAALTSLCSSTQVTQVPLGTPTCKVTSEYWNLYHYVCDQLMRWTMSRIQISIWGFSAIRQHQHFYRDKVFNTFIYMLSQTTAIQ